MGQAVEYLAREKDSGNLSAVYACATPLQQAFRMLGHAWMHLWSLSLNVPKLGGITCGLQCGSLEDFIVDNTEAAFYFGKIVSSRFYLNSEFYRFFGILDSIMTGESAVAESFDDIFAGAMV